MINYEKTINDLRNLGIKEKLLARRLKKQGELTKYGHREFKYMNKTDDKLYATFLRLVDDSTKERLIYLDTAIEKIETTIYKKSGWWRTSDGFTLEDNFTNMHDPEFRSWDTYTIYRTEDGYTVRTDKPFNGYFEYIRRKEIEFFNKFKDLLQQLHLLLKEKEMIMRGSYKLKDESNRELTTNISILLGYKKEEKRLNL